MSQHENPTPTEQETEQINASIRYTMYSVFRVTRELPSARDELISQTQAFVDSLGTGGEVVVRGMYDVGGLRADADLMVWWHSADIEALQSAYRGFLATPLGRHLDGVWSNVGLHRPAEFNRGHVPAFLAGEPARHYLCVYPFVRSYDWYLLPEDERRTMLRDHGLAARDFADVRANTVASFALGDYEWLLAFEADELHRIVDLMRALRETEARRHVREELPFYTGPQTSVAQFAAGLR